MYVELIEHDITRRGTVVELTQVPNNPRNYECYMTLFPFDVNILNYVARYKTVKGYRGSCYVFPALFIDIDNEENVEEAHASTLELITRLIDDYGMNQNDLMIYFSGRKGFHVGIPSWAIGITQPEVGIAERCKMFVKELTKGITNIDDSIYNDNRIFRTVNSLNLKGNLYKIPLTFNQITDDFFNIKLLAKNPITDFVRPVSQKSINQKLNSLWNLSVTKEVLTYSEISSTGLFSPKGKGNRNTGSFDQAAILLKNGINRHEVWKVLLLANSQNEPPLEEAELRTIYESALRSVKIDTKQIDVRPFGEFLDDWIESIQTEKNQISLKFPLFDKEMKGKLRGKLCCVIHYGGTKKSLLAQNITWHNVMHEKQRVIYSSMEMGTPELTSRFIDMAIKGEFYNASYELEQKERENPNYVRGIKNNLASCYGDRLMITPTASMEAPDYKVVLNKVINENGNVDILVVDGLSMMGGKDDETALVSRHTKELKELAKEYNIFIIAIVHASKGAEKHHRDVSQKARGSEKIIDNCDFYICPSLLIENVAEGDVEYEQWRGYLRLVNKRGSGNTVNLIYSFDSQLLHMDQSSDDPKQVEKSIRKGIEI
jgi:archaellum biogenesis ATPase FlaH